VSEIITPLGGKVQVVPTAIYSDWQNRELPDGSVHLILRMQDPSDMRLADIILSPENCADLVAELQKWSQS
jgi:hypothetical protein